MSLLDDLNLSEGIETTKDKKTISDIKTTLNHVDSVVVESPGLINKSAKPRKARSSETKRRAPRQSQAQKDEQYQKDKKKWTAIITGESYKMTQFNEEYCEKIVEYFASASRFRTVTDKSYNNEGILIKEVERIIPCSPPLFSSFATLLGVHTVTLNRWRKEFSSFDEAYLISKDIQASHIVSNSMEDITKGNFSTLMMKNNHGWSDKTEVKTQSVKTLEDTINESFSEPIEVENEYKPKELEHDEDI